MKNTEHQGKVKGVYALIFFSIYRRHRKKKSLDLLREDLTSFTLQLNVVVQHVPERYGLKEKREQRRWMDYGRKPRGWR